jgi:Lrp/AsnC family leucine-responsive transcriptional regulator
VAAAKSHLDDVDVQILVLLQSDGRITNADLAKQVNLSPPSVLQRVRNLEKLGLIRGYHGLLEPERVGFKITAWVQVTLALHQEQPIERFRKSIRELPEVLEVYHVSGDYDYLIKVVVRDMRAYEVFIRERLTKIKAVQQVRTNFVMATTKHTTQLPIL